MTVIICCWGKDRLLINTKREKRNTAYLLLRHQFLKLKMAFNFLKKKKNGFQLVYIMNTVASFLSPGIQVMNNLYTFFLQDGLNHQLVF